MPYLLTIPDLPPKAPQFLGAGAVAVSAGFLLLPLFKSFCHGFLHAPARHKSVLKEEKNLRDNLSNHQVDDIVEESFPASDPPANY